MKWIDAELYWPGKNARNIIIDGSTLLILKPEFWIKPPLVDQAHEFSVYVKYFCLIEEPLPYLENYAQNISIDGALFYEIESFCCTSDESRRTHTEHADRIGLYEGNVRDFVKDPKLIGAMDAIQRWAYLFEEE